MDVTSPQDHDHTDVTPVPDQAIAAGNESGDYVRLNLGGRRSVAITEGEVGDLYDHATPLASDGVYNVMQLNQGKQLVLNNVYDHANLKC